MKVNSFEITNFKGIASTKIQVDDQTPGNIITLIGLNESGKTTILEALSYFLTGDKDTEVLVGTVQRKASLHDLIPKDKKAAFTGSISIIANVIIEKKDIDALSQMYIKEHSLFLDAEKIESKISVKKSIVFKDSSLELNRTSWEFEVSLKTKRAKKFTLYDGEEKAGPDARKVWVDGLKLLQKRMPKIVYFPTFLFNFPDRIYLEGDDDETNQYYVQVLQDILDSQGEGLDVKRHIVDRIARLREEHASPASFMAFLFGRDEKKQIDAVLQKASNEMSRVIFGSWNQILGRNVTGKRVQIDWLLDSKSDNIPYLEVSIVDGQSRFSLSERSLGFRWFFSFLLFTQFRRNRRDDGSTIFLFDEPAANLHSKAQMKLLESFSKIANGSTFIIYSTHSHYMVNPLWLEKAYIVDNKANNYENEDEVDSFAIRKTEIGAVRYRTFVGTNPSKTTYFQPVLDALDVSFSPLMRSSEALIVEGKNDFHAFVYLRRCSSTTASPEVFPVNGASDAVNLISLFRGWGVRFVVLLDDDQAGITAKKKYLDEYMLSDSEVVTIGDISPSLRGREFEDIYKDDVRGAVASAYDTVKVTKRQFSLFFQELLATGSATVFPQTQDAFKPISQWIDARYADHPSQAESG